MTMTSLQSSGSLEENFLAWMQYGKQCATSGLRGGEAVAEIPATPLTQISGQKHIPKAVSNTAGDLSPAQNCVSDETVASLRRPQELFGISHNGQLSPQLATAAAATDPKSRSAVSIARHKATASTPVAISLAERVSANKLDQPEVEPATQYLTPTQLRLLERIEQDTIPAVAGSKPVDTTSRALLITEQETSSQASPSSQIKATAEAPAAPNHGEFGPQSGRHRYPMAYFEAMQKKFFQELQAHEQDDTGEPSPLSAEAQILTPTTEAVNPQLVEEPVLFEWTSDDKPTAPQIVDGIQPGESVIASAVPRVKDVAKQEPAEMHDADEFDMLSRLTSAVNKLRRDKKAQQIQNVPNANTDNSEVPTVPVNSVTMATILTRDADASTVDVDNIDIITATQDNDDVVATAIIDVETRSEASEGVGVAATLDVEESSLKITLPADVENPANISPMNTASRQSSIGPLPSGNIPAVTEASIVQPAKPSGNKTVVLRILPPDTTYTLIALLVENAEIAEMRYYPALQLARVMFSDAAKCQQYLTTIVGGIKGEHNGARFFATAERSSEPDNDDVLETLIACGAKRSVKVKDVDMNTTMQAIVDMAAAFGRNIESITDEWSHDGRSTTIGFCSIYDAVAFRKVCLREKCWKAKVVQFV